MCFNKPKPLPKPTPPPEKPAEPVDVGSARKAEDQELFGGVPDLRTDTSITDQGAAAGGSGVNMM